MKMDFFRSNSARRKSRKDQNCNNNSNTTTTTNKNNTMTTNHPTSPSSSKKMGSTTTQTHKSKSDILDELVQLASSDADDLVTGSPSRHHQFHHHRTESAQQRLATQLQNGTIIDTIVAGVASNLSANSKNIGDSDDDSTDSAGDVEIGAGINLAVCQSPLTTSSLSLCESPLTSSNRSAVALLVDSDEDDGANFFDDEEDENCDDYDEDILRKSPRPTAGGVNAGWKSLSQGGNNMEDIRDLLNTPLTIPTFVQPTEPLSGNGDGDGGGVGDGSVVGSATLAIGGGTSAKPISSPAISSSRDPEHSADDGTIFSDDDEEDGEDNHKVDEGEEEDEEDDDEDDEPNKSSESGEDYTDDEDEGESGYKNGGYHPVKAGDLFNKRYFVTKKLGWGHFSTVWMVDDRKTVATGKFHHYALKVQKSAEHYTEAAMDEVELLDCIQTKRKQVIAMEPVGTDEDGVSVAQMVEYSRYVATLRDSFFHVGPNGRHMCMVFSVLGCNLLSVIKAYNYRGIPIPVVKKMIQGVCKGLDFLHRKCKIIHTDLKPENVLLQFPNQFDDDDDVQIGFKKLSLHDDADECDPGTAHSEAALRDQNISIEARRKARASIILHGDKGDRGSGNQGGQRTLGGGRGVQVGESSESDDSLLDVLGGTSENNDLSSALTSSTIDSIFNRSSAGNDGKTAVRETRNHVKRRFNHSPFVLCNFGPNPTELDTRLMHIMQESIILSRTNADEFQSAFYEAEQNGGIAEVSFLVRAFTPEEELADSVSIALNGIRWDTGHRSDTRDWRCKILIPPSCQKSGSASSVSTYFQLTQQTRKHHTYHNDRQELSDLAVLISANLCDDEDSDADTQEIASSSLASRQNKALPFSMFKVKFPVKSTCMVLGLLESRLPGVLFMIYRREEGNPRLDNIVFGQNERLVCNHADAMRIRDAPLDPSCAVATCIIGFDLRLVKDCAARPTVDEDGTASFEIDTSSNDKVAGWWFARNSIRERLKSFTGVEPTSDIINMLEVEDTKDSRKGASVAGGPDAFIYHEGYKKAPTTTTAATNDSSSTDPSSSLEKSPAAARHNYSDDFNNNDGALSPNTAKDTHSPDLRDKDLLKQCRSVIVDLGNACWTHRHFSEDIQTRQYRAPEVLIGNRYDTSADIWSLGAMTFELLTGDLLFDPRAGDDYDRDDDHLAMFQELLGKIPKRIALDGKYSKNFFDKKGNLKNIKQLKFWPIQDVLVEKYHFSEKDAQGIADFMTPLLDFDSDTRATALEALRSDWLNF